MDGLPIAYKRTFNLFTDLLRWIGIDIFGQKPGFRNVSSTIKLFVFNIILLPFVAVQFSLISEINADNFLESSQVIPMCLMFLLDIIKMLSLLTKKDVLISIFSEIGMLWPVCEGEKAVVMKLWLQRMGILVKLFFIYAVVNLVTFEVFPFLLTCYSRWSGLSVYVLPFRYPAAWVVDSMSRFMLTYVVQLAATAPCQLCLYLPYDLLIVTMTANVSILLRLLQIDLTSSIKHGQAIDNDYAEIVRIVKIHQILLSVVDKLNNVFGLVVFIHVAFSSVEICFFGFLTVVYGGFIETIVNLLTVWNAVITIFLLALSGQLLSDTSSAVADAAYNSLWYDADPKVKRLTLFIIIRSQRPCYLSALGYSNMTLQSFSKIMSSAWTYFSLLIQFYQQN